jgi:anti-sigma regulatory factor (Ser/Thr protein kinase)
MVTIELTSFEDVRRARERVGQLARAAGLPDPEAAVMAAGELGNNCVEHGGAGPGLLRVQCGPGRLSLQFENPCGRRPRWRTQKPVVVAGFRSGGYGLPMARALARRVDCRWQNGRAVVCAEFDGLP